MANLIPDPSGVANSSKYYVKVGDACVTAENFPGDAFASWPVVDLESGDLILSSLEGLEYLFITNQFQVYNSASLGGLAYRPVGLYQDLAGTIPAVLPGDKIARWDDVVTTSGLSLTQPDESLRPELQFEKNAAGIWVPVVRFWADSPSQLIGSASVDLWAGKRGGIYASYESSTTVSGNPLAVGGGLSLNWNAWRFNDPGDSFGANDAIDNGPVRWSLVRSSDANHDYYEFGVQVSTKANDTAGNYSGIPQVSNASGWAGDMHGFAYTSTGTYRSDIDSYLAARSPAAINLNQIVVVDGNELTLGVGASNPSGGYPDQLASLLGSSWLVKNFGVVGQETPDMSLDGATQIDSAFGSASKKLLIAWEGSNHLKGGATPEQAYNEIVQYCSDRRAAGEEVIVLTVLPRSDAGTPGGFEADRQTLNTSIRDGWTSFADALVDVAADSRIGDSGDETGIYYSGDDFTLNNSGYAVVAGRVNGTIPALDETIDNLEIALRVEEEYQNPTTRLINGTVRYANDTTNGSPRQMKRKYGLYSEAITEYATLSPLPDALDFQEDDLFTISLWVKCNGAHDAGALINTGNTTSGWELIHSSAQQIVFNWFGSSNLKGAATAPINLHSINEWTHVVARWDGIFFKLYINGVDSTDLEYAVGDPLGDASSVANNLRLFQRANGTYEKFRTAIDDVRIYDVALTPSEIQTLTSVKPGGAPPVLAEVPIAHWTMEDPLSSRILKNSGSLKNADLSLVGDVAVLRSQLGYFSYANSAGYGASFTTDGVDDYIDTGVTLNGATAFTVFMEARYLSTNAYDLDGFYTTSVDAIRIGRDTGNNQVYATPGVAAVNLTPGTPIPNGEITTLSLQAAVGGNYNLRVNGTSVASGGSTMSAFTNTKNYLIGVSDSTTVTHHSHAEYTRYLIASRVLTSDELAWLDSGGAYGTPIDFLNDPDILVYYDFEKEHPDFVYNRANPSLPGIIVGGEWSTVPRSSVDTDKDVQQAGSSYRTAVSFPGSTNKVDFGSVLIGATDDFDISFDFKADTLADEMLFSQHTAAVANRMSLIMFSTGAVQLYVASTPAVLILSGGGLVKLGQWHTLRATRAGDVFSLYFDGTLVGTQTQAGVSVLQKNTMLGTDDGTLDDFHGLISNVNINGTTFLTGPGETSPDSAIKELTFEATFPGSANRVDLGVTLIGATDDFDISFDFKADTLTTDFLFTQWTDAIAGRMYITLIDNGSVEFYVQGSLGNVQLTSSAGSVTAGRWYTVRATRVGDVFTLYLDDMQIGTQTRAGISVEQVVTRLGTSRTASDDFDGKIANVRIQSGNTLTEYLTKDIALPGATLTNATVAFASFGLVNVMRGRPGTLTHTGLVPRDAVISNSALLLNGLNQQVTVPHRNNFNFGDASSDLPFSVSAWVYVDSHGASKGAVLGKAYDVTAGNCEWLFQMDDTGKPIFVMYDDTSVHSIRFAGNDSVSTGEWIHLVGTYNGSGSENGIKIYVNGISITGTATENGVYVAMHSTTTVVTIGGSFSPTIYDRWLDGQISNVKIFDYELSSSEVYDLYAGTLASSPIGHWPLDEVSGDICYDVSGNNNHGTGAPPTRSGSQNLIDTHMTDGYSVATWFDGTNDWFTYDQNIGAEATAFSVGGWINPVTTSDMEVAACAIFNATGRVWRFRITAAGQPQLIISSDGTSGNQNNFVCPITVRDNEWIRVDITWDGATQTVKFYLNATLAYETTGSFGQLSSDTTVLTIGNNSAVNAPYEGMLSHFTVEPNAVWSPSEITSLMDVGKPSEVAAIRPNAYYFPDGKNEANQGLSSPAIAGAPEQRVLPVMQPQASAYALGTYYDGNSYYNRTTPLYSTNLRQISVAAYVKLEKNNITIAGEWNEQPPGTNEWSWTLYTNSGANLALALSSNGSGVTDTLISSGHPLELGVTYHVACVADLTAGYIRLYINDKEIGNTSTAQPLLAVGTGFTIANRDVPFNPTANPFKGNISNLIIEDAAWNEHELSRLRRAGTPAEVAAIRPNAYYFPEGNSKETNQGLPALTRSGVPRQTVLPALLQGDSVEATWFDGANDSYSRSTLVGVADRLCIYARFMLDVVGVSHVICSEYDSTGNDRSFQLSIRTDRRIQMNVSNDGLGPSPAFSDSGTLVNANEWYDLFVQYDGTDGSVYFELNGVDVSEYSTEFPMRSSSSDFYIGSNQAGATFFKGVMHKLLIHKNPTQDWSSATRVAIRNASTDEVPAVVSGLGGTAWYFPAANNAETLQGIAPLTKNGNPLRRILESDIPVGTWYDGTNDSYSRPTLVGGATTLCISCKLLLDSVAAPRTICGEYNATGDQRSWLFYVNTGGELLFGASEDGLLPAFATTLTSLSVGVLYDVQLLYSAGSVAIEVNGVDDTDVSATDASAWSGTTAQFYIGARSDGLNRMNGTISQLLIHKNPTAVWNATQKAAIRNATTTQEISDIVDGLGGTAWYFPHGDGLTETLQNLDPMTQNGEPEQNYLYNGKVAATYAAGTTPPGLPAISYGPGVLAPGQSLDLYCGENESPYAQRLSGYLADGVYSFGDGNEGDIIFTYNNETHEELVVLEDPDASDRIITILDKHFKL